MIVWTGTTVPGTTIANSCGTLLGSVRSATMNPAMFASVVIVPVRSLLARFSKSNSTGISLVAAANVTISVTTVFAARS